jgi:hypothetical protein
VPAFDAHPATGAARAVTDDVHVHVNRTDLGLLLIQRRNSLSPDCDSARRSKIARPRSRFEELFLFGVCQLGLNLNVQHETLTLSLVREQFRNNSFGSTIAFMACRGLGGGGSICGKCAHNAKAHARAGTKNVPSPARF